MADSLETGDYATLKQEVERKQIFSIVAGTAGALLLGVAVAAGVAAFGIGLPFLIGLGAPACAAIAGAAGLVGGATSWQAMRTDIQLNMDYQELASRRNAENMRLVLKETGGKSLTPEQAAVVGAGMGQSNDAYYPQNQRADKLAWTNVVADGANLATDVVMER